MFIFVLQNSSSADLHIDVAYTFNSAAFNDYAADLQFLYTFRLVLQTFDIADLQMAVGAYFLFCRLSY